VTDRPIRRASEPQTRCRALFPRVSSLLGGLTAAFLLGVEAPASFAATPGFYTVTPCRVADTRNPDGPFGGPALAAGAIRTFTIAEQCGVPSTATAVSVNITVTQPAAQGHLTLYPGGAVAPLVSAINYRPGQTRANNAVVPLGPAKDFAVRCGSIGTVHFIIDVNGYFDDGSPPDPGTLAPPIDPSVATDIAKTTEFLYTGPNPIQTGVAPGTIEARRAAVLRGRVLTRDGTPLSAVRITILLHPSFGQTLSRADGMFDMAVNGGGLMTGRYEKTGFLPAQRQLSVPWRDFAFLPDVSLIPLDSRVTTIDLNAAVPIQVARGNPVTDADGTRQATVLFPAGTTAGLVQPDGSTLPATTLNVRLTEYTVGPNGPKAMPAELPPTSGYTYAAELGVDEAVAKVNGRDVVFNQPVFFYVENFVGIPVGEAVPVGYYDPARSAWVGSQNGRVIKVLGTTAGLADLDLDGDGLTDGAAALAALGITDAERQQLASLYAAGTSLWRTPLNHFSTFDCNWSVICVPGTCSPPKEPPGTPPPPPKPSYQCGSVIGCERQTLGEQVELAGSPFTLHYQSDLVPGRTAEQSLLLALGTRGVPAGVQGTELEVLVAGQKLTQSVPATSTGATVTWDGKDAYGRQVQGSQRVTVRIGYRYKVVYAKGITVRIAWAQLSGVPMTGSPARMEVTLFQEWTGTITRWDSRGQGLGGWSLSPLHAYDPVGRVLHLGDGTRRDAESLGAGAINTFAGGGSVSGDGGPATQATISHPFGLAVGPDGSLYIADSGNHRVRRVGPNGIITTVAGTGTPGYSGDARRLWRASTVPSTWQWAPTAACTSRSRAITESARCGRTASSSPWRATASTPSAATAGRRRRQG